MKTKVHRAHPYTSLHDFWKEGSSKVESGQKLGPCFGSCSGRWQSKSPELWFSWTLSNNCIWFSSVRRLALTGGRRGFIQTKASIFWHDRKIFSSYRSLWAVCTPWKQQHPLELQVSGRKEETAWAKFISSCIRFCRIDRTSGPWHLGFLSICVSLVKYWYLGCLL